MGNICEVCGAEFTPSKYNRYAKYCSKECQRKAANRLRRKQGRSRGERVLPVRTRICEGCGKEFESRANNVKFCSRSCYMRFRLALEKANYVSQRTVEKRVCPFCGKEFETLRSNMKFCSRQCRIHAQYHATKEEMEQKKKAREEEARTRAVNAAGGITEEQRREVIRAQSSDRDTLWRASQKWTPEQRNYAARRWEALHPSGFKSWE